MPNSDHDPQQGLNEFVHRNLKRNFSAHFVHGLLGMTGFRLVTAPTFVPAYLYLMTGSTFMVGLGQALQQAGAILSPMMGATQIERRRRVLSSAVWIGALMRLQLLGLALAGWLLGGSALVVSTLIFLFLFGFFMGSQRVAFQVLLAKVIPIQRRGTLQAWRNFAGGAVAALLSYWAGAVLVESNTLGNGYATTFFVSFVLTSLGLLVLAVLMREPAALKVKAKTTISRRLEQVSGLLEDRGYTYFLVAQTLTMAGRISIPFCIIFAGRQMELDGASIGLITFAFLGAETLSNLVWGAIGDRRGFRVIFIAAVLVWFSALTFLLVSTELWQFIVSFCGLGAAISGHRLAAMTMVLEFGEQEDIPMRIALSTTVETTMSTLGPLLGGIVSIYYGLEPIFVASLVFLGAAILVLLTKVDEPRFRADN